MSTQKHCPNCGCELPNWSPEKQTEVRTWLAIAAATAWLCVHDVVTWATLKKPRKIAPQIFWREVILITILFALADLAVFLAVKRHFQVQP